MTTVVLVIVSLALIIMSVVYAVTARALFMERRKNIEQIKELCRPTRIEVKKLSDPSYGSVAEYDVLVDDKVIQTIKIPECSKCRFRREHDQNPL